MVEWVDMMRECDLEELKPRKVEKVYDVIKVVVEPKASVSVLPARYCYKCGVKNGERWNGKYDTLSGEKVFVHYCNNVSCSVDCEHDYSVLHSRFLFWKTFACSKCGEVDYHYD